MFGFPVFELRVTNSAGGTRLARALRDWTRERLPAGKTFVFTKIPSTDLQTSQVLSEAGFYVAEATLKIAVPLAKVTPIPAPKRPLAVLRKATEADLPVAVEIARTAFSRDRFHLDPGFPTERADQRYASWLSQGYCDGDPFYVFESVGPRPSILGFYLLKKISATTVNLALAGLSAPYLHSGLGGVMYQDMLTVCSKLGFTRAETNISATNVAVANIYARLGFGIIDVLFCLHRFGG